MLGALACAWPHLACGLSRSGVLPGKTRSESLLHVTMCLAFQAVCAASWNTEGPNNEFGESSGLGGA